VSEFNITQVLMNKSHNPNPKPPHPHHTLQVFADSAAVASHDLEINEVVNFFCETSFSCAHAVV